MSDFADAGIGTVFERTGIMGIVVPDKSLEGLDTGSDRDITAEIDEAEWEGIGHSGAQNESSDSDDDSDGDGDGDGDGGE